MKTDNRHTFACFFQEQSASFSGDVVTVADKPLYQRVSTVLRLREGDNLILFSTTHVYSGVLEAEKKNVIILTAVKRELSSSLNPSLVLVLPLLKKSSFEDALYAAAQMGVTEIVPFKTQKSQYKGDFEGERERMTSIMIAACEQAKQFVLPALKSPVTVEVAVKAEAGQKLLCDVDGEKLSSVLTTSAQKSLALSMGPEGGLTEQERELFIKNGWKPVLFTPSILRSIDMVLVGIGLLRSWYR